jgi:hypothetical protein
MLCDILLTRKVYADVNAILPMKARHVASVFAHKTQISLLASTII